MHTPERRRKERGIRRNIINVPSEDSLSINFVLKPASDKVS
jgi:hypothetical protein